MTPKRTAYLRFVFAALLIASALLLAACPPRQPIESVNRDPGRFHGKEITVVGRVVNSFAVMGEGAFQLDDGTGRIWVYSSNFGVPGREARVGVTGRIEQGFSLHGRNFATILRETRPRHY
ncbi:MAG TPA: OB-fold nucleic acid binding domain-containing protein [Terriglobales bacterium]|nr:OB-fold nucleic acid binding domain-containing protein [Terriglobales bacterium]